MKKNRINIYFLLSLVLLGLSVPLQPSHTVMAQEKTDRSEIQVAVYPKSVSYNENAVVSITIPDSFRVAEVSIDASSLGGPTLTVDTELLEQTIAVSDQTTAGEKILPIQIMDETGETTELEATIEVLPREITDVVDFDWDEAVIYFLMTDRFMDGDETNNDPNSEHYDISHSETYHGGDLQGVIDQLDYLEALGINTIWITPIVDNVDHNHRHGKEGAQYSYHGYWAKDFTKIDEHLGDLETLKTLIDEAHDRGIKLMVDVVLNHTGYGMKISDSGEGIPNFPTPEEQAVFEGMLREDPLPGHDILGEIYGLPDFKSEEEAVRNQIIQWQVDWLERARTDRGDTIDYFRVDTIKHMEDTTWNAFKNELTKMKPDFKIIGENWGAAYNNTGGYLNSGQMDALLDFDFKRIASLFTNGNIEQAEAELTRRNEAINNMATVGHFLSSHDEDGFLYYFMQGDEDLFKVAISLQLTAKGQPVIYYGEEIGMSGEAEGDMDLGEFSENREDFDWEAAEGHHLVEHYQKLLASRSNHSKVFAKGNREQLAGSNADGFSVFSRNYENQTIIVALNTTAESKKAEITVPFDPGLEWVDEYNQVHYNVTEDSTLDIEIPSYKDGGTVILALAPEAEAGMNGKNKSVQVALVVIIFIGIGGIGLYFWTKRK